MPTYALTPAQFVAKWTERFAYNQWENIDDAAFREYSQDIAATFGTPAVNVPAYLAGTDYTPDYLVRYTPPGGRESFYYALQAGKLPAPPAGQSDANWRLVPGPVSATQLAQAITLAEAQGAWGASVTAGRRYAVAGKWNGAAADQVVYLDGLENYFRQRGTLLDPDTGAQQEVDVDVLAGTYVAASSGTSSEFKDDSYSVQASDLPAPFTIPVPGAVLFANVGVTGTNGSLNPLAPEIGDPQNPGGYSSSYGELTILAAANVQAGWVIHYSYLTGSNLGNGGGNGYTDANAVAAVTAALVQANPQHQGVQVADVGGLPVLTVAGLRELYFEHPAPGTGNLVRRSYRLRYPYQDGAYSWVADSNIDQIEFTSAGSSFSGSIAQFRTQTFSLIYNQQYSVLITPVNVNQPVLLEMVQLQ